MGEMKTCCFYSSSLKFDIYDDSREAFWLRERLLENIITLIENYGVLRFICGMGPYIGIYAAETVLTLKRKYPDITLGCVIAFEEQAARFSAALHERYYAVLEQCDIETTVGRRFSKNSMQNHFRYMIDRSDILVAIWDGKQSQRRMASAAKYAEDNHIKVIRIDPYYNI